MRRLALIGIPCLAIATVVIWLLINAAPPTYPGLQYPSTDNRIALTCFHVAIDKDTIRGVITVNNIGKEPFDMFQRWNSWGSRQWKLIIGTCCIAGNPQMAWTMNYAQWTTILPGEIRAVSFILYRNDESNEKKQNSKTEWVFCPQGWDDPIHNKHIDGCSANDLLKDHDIHLILEVTNSEAIQGEKEISETGHEAPHLWTGELSVKSERLDSVENLDKRLVGIDGKPIKGEL